MDKDNKTYEINYLMSPLIPEDKAAEEAALLRKIIEDNNGFVISEDQPKAQKLSYPIKKFDVAYYGWFRFSATAGSLDNIKNILNKNEKILRILIAETGKENPVQFSPRKIIRKPKPKDLSPESSEKVEIKPEQIDQKLEEILKESTL